jgi:alpha-glucosidase
LYQGDELGLPEAQISFEELQDPYGKVMWPEFKGRDGCRTPMPWSAELAQAGFSTAAGTWLPVSKTHVALAVDKQQADAGSLLNFYTQLMAWRREQPALVKGSMTLLPKDAQILIYVREHEGVKVLCVFNFSAQEAFFDIPNTYRQVLEISGSGLSGGLLRNNRLHLKPWGGWFASVQ